jgi:hypothetical protein
MVRIGALLVAAVVTAQAGHHAAPSKVTLDADTALIVVTDMEPDDRIALQVLAAHVHPDRIAVAGTTVLHAGLKLDLARRLFDQIRYTTAPLYQGHGGEPDAYQPHVRSTAPARSYRDEGKGILSDAVLDQLRTAPRASDALALAIRRQLLEARRPSEIILLAPPTDLLSALDGMSGEERARALRNLRRIHVMGGWSTARDGTLRTTYNWSMAPRESRALMALEGVDIVLYSSHAILPVFQGSVNRDTAPWLWSVVERLTPTSASLGDGLIAQRSWDQVVVDHYPEVGDQIARYAGHQFTPADPFVMVGALDESFIRAGNVRPVRVTIGAGEDDFDPATGYRVTVTDDPRSRVLLVDGFDKAEFETFTADSLERLPRPDRMAPSSDDRSSTTRGLALAALALAAAGFAFRRRRSVFGRGTPAW